MLMTGGKPEIITSSRWNLHTARKPRNSRLLPLDSYVIVSREQTKLRRRKKVLLYSIHAENDMPQELHHPSALRIAHCCIHDPLPELLIVAHWPLQYPFS